MRRFLSLSNRIVFVASMLAIITSTWTVQPLRAAQRLAWKFRPGDKFLIATEQTMIMQDDAASPEDAAVGDKSKMPDKKPAAPSADRAGEGAKIGMDTEWQVDKVDAQGTATITQTVRRLYMSMDLPDKTQLRVDTKEPTVQEGANAAQLMSFIKPLIGVKANLTVAATGEVSAVRLGADVKKAIQGQAASPLEGMFSEEGIKNMHKQMGAILPNKPVDVGGKWESQSDSKSMLGGMRIDNKFTYLGRGAVQRKSLEKIGYETKYSLLPNSDTPPNVKVNLQDQSGQGTAYFDANAGRFVECQSQSQLTMTTTLGQESTNQKITILTRTTFTPQ